MIPLHEEKILEAHVRKVPLNRLSLEQINRPLNEYEEKEFAEFVRLRNQGIPLQYLTGTQDFYGRTFYVNTSVLIPRPETEGLVEHALKTLPELPFPIPSRREDRLQVLDFGTGSGCIALTLAQERPDLNIYASDAHKETLLVAEENAVRFRAGNVDFIHVSEDPQIWQYDEIPYLDLLIANPPYLTQSDNIADDVRLHEPASALFAPDIDPLFFYRFLIQLAEKKLKQNADLWLEIAEQRGGEMLALFDSNLFDCNLYKDLTGRNRYIHAKKKLGDK